METVVSTFASSLAAHDASLTRATAAETPAVLDDLLETPAVGVALDSVGVDLADLETDVNTDPTTEALFSAASGVTPAAWGIADYGSVVLQGTEDGEEPISLYPEHHVAVLAESDVHQSMADAIDRIAAAVRDGNRSHIVATGPSATADMGELVLGAHGPKAVDVVVVTDR
ncbi:MAG: LUD domain-containing protein [Halanaeroarchaeum sp.]